MANRHRFDQLNWVSVFRRLEELILANSGEDAFEEALKLTAAKVHVGVSQNRRRLLGESGEETRANVDAVLKEVRSDWAVEFDDGVRLEPGHLQVCLGMLEEIDLTAGSLDALDALFESLVSRTQKGSKGQFFTPRNVVDAAVRILNPKDGWSVADIACGSGAFLLHAQSHVRDEGGAIGAWGFDLDPRAIRVSRILQAVSGGDPRQMAVANSLSRQLDSQLMDDRERLDTTIEGLMGPSFFGFDAILTNPPFAGEVLERGLLEEYELGRGRARVERDVLFIERSIELLKPGGRLAIVLPHNKLSAASFEYIRRWLFDKVRIVAVLSLERETFQPHTGQKADVLFAQKFLLGEKPNRDREILFMVSEKSGKDKQGRWLTNGADSSSVPWRAADDDLEDAVAKFDELSDSGVGWAA